MPADRELSFAEVRDQIRGMYPDAFSPRTYALAGVIDRTQGAHFGALAGLRVSSTEALVLARRISAMPESELPQPFSNSTSFLDRLILELRAVPSTGEIAMPAPVPRSVGSLTDQRILAALQSDRFLYKMLCIALLDPEFFTHDRQMRHREFWSATLPGRASQESLQRAVVGGSDQLLQEIRAWKDFLSLSETYVWPPVYNVVRELVSFVRDRQVFWDEAFSQQVSVLRERGYSREMDMVVRDRLAGAAMRSPASA